MGLLKVIKYSIGGGFADQWLEVVEPEDLSKGVIYTQGVLFRRGEDRFGNNKKNRAVISNGSIIHVPENTCMIMTDGGEVIEVSAEPGYFEVNNSSAPSLFAGQLGDSFKHTLQNIKYAGVERTKQEVFYINLQEMTDIKFGTATPIMYYDEKYDMDLQVRAHGSYSIQVKDPVLFYENVVPKSETILTIDSLSKQYVQEFLTGLQQAISELSVQGVKISHLGSKGIQLKNALADALDEEWLKTRGIDIVSVALSSISYTENSQKILDMRSKGAALKDASIRQGYVQGSIARGFEAAGGNSAGSGQAFMGMGFGMNAAGGMFGEMTKGNSEEILREQNKVESKRENVLSDSWNCPQCSTNNVGKFCSECGTKKPEAVFGGFCTNCGTKFDGEKPKFCPECGNKNY